MAVLEEQPIVHFSLYPPLGLEDWSYTYAAAQVRTLEEKMLDIAFLTEMANAASAGEAIEMLSGTDYAIPANASFEQIEQMLIERRTQLRQLFEQLVPDEKVVEYVKARVDYENMRLVIRRLVLENPLGADYCGDGNIPINEFGLVFEQEDYTSLPDYLREGVEAGVLGYYKNKNVRDIDIEIDKSEAEFQVKNALTTGNAFLLELQKMRIDLNNLRTMLRLKFVGSQETDVFMPGGYLESSRLVQNVDTAYESIASVFAATPYWQVLDAGVGYLQKEGSFLKLEAACDAHLLGYLKMTSEITAGLQPVVAYLLRKEHEIRMVRMILTAKRNSLEPRLMLDRLTV